MLKIASKILKEGILFILNFIGMLSKDDSISDIASSMAFLETCVPSFSRENVMT